MAYVSLYRKYRPQNFEDVVGQDHITRTLKNAIREGRIASGYLFCGTRGTAKTTCARILAKALNCIGLDGTLTAPTPEPCGVCGPCQAIANSSFVDVIEMDAASHGKVDDVREIVAAVKFQPMEGRYKVYIVDEAHQLSRDAMDAFLKTLEEPPDRVLFILATTDAEKLPITIASRCQVFEFKRGSVPQIASRLNEVLKAEGITAAPAAVTLVARAADGSYRDSLSLLEQVLAYKRENIAPADVAAVLGTVDEDMLERVVGLIADSDAAGAFALAGSILESGKDVRQFLKSLTGRFRDMLFVGVGAQPQASGEMDDSATVRAQAARFAPASLLSALEVLTEAEREMRTNTQHRLLLEMALLRLMRLPSSPALPPPAAPAPVLAASSLPSAFPPAAEATVFDIPPPIDLDEEDSESLDDEDALAESRIVTSLEEIDDLPVALLDEADEEAGEDFLLIQQVAAPPALANGQNHPAVAVAETAEELPEVLTRLQRSWQEVINRVGSNKPAAAALIKDGRAVALQGRTFMLEFTSAFNVDRITKNEAGRHMIEDQINRTLGEPEGTYLIKGRLRGDESSPGRVAQGTAPRIRETAARPIEPSAHQASFDPLMDEVIAVFGGRIEDDDVKG